MKFLSPKKMELWESKNSIEFSEFENCSSIEIPVGNILDMDSGELIPICHHLTRLDFLSGDNCKHIPIESDLWKQNERTIIKHKINKLINENIF